MRSGTVAVSPQTKRICVANYGQESYSLSILDATDPGKPAVIGELKLGQVPIDVAVNTRTNRVFVANPFQRRIHVIDGATNTELSAIDVGVGPGGLVVEKETNRLYVARSQVPVGLGGSQPVDVTVSARNNRVYVACLGNPQAPPAIQVLDSVTLAPVAFVRTIATPHAVCIDPGRNQLYIGTDSGLQVLDGANSAMVLTAQKSPAMGRCRGPRHRPGVLRQHAGWQGEPDPRVGPQYRDPLGVAASLGRQQPVALRSVFDGVCQLNGPDVRLE